MGKVINFPEQRAPEQRNRRVWGRIETDDPPRDAYDFARLLTVAERMLASREKRFPVMVREGKLEAAEAERELVTFRAIVADWRWLESGEGQPAPIGSLPCRRAALDRSIGTIAEIARDEGCFSDELAAQADAVIAMRWHLEPGSRTHALAHVTHEIRREITAGAAAPKEAAHAE